MNVAQLPACKHCGLAVLHQQDSFCCVGCETVYTAIHELGLTDFYKYRQDQGQRVAHTPGDAKFNALDDPSLISKAFVASKDGILSGRLFLSGIHCAGCIWLIEALPKILPGLIASRASFGSGTIDVVYDPSMLTLSQIASQLDRLGYRVHVGAHRMSSADTAAKEQHKTMLLRIGVAAVCASNAMMLAVSLWQGLLTGIEAQYASLFRYWSLLIALPAMLYSAVPFYRNAIFALRVSKFHIDLPISIALIGAFIASIANTVLGRSNVYFDSVCMLVFLLLSGRYLQQRTVERAQDRSRFAWSIFPDTARVVENGEYREVVLSSVSAELVCEVRSGERIPADGIIESGEAAIDSAILSGESTPKVLGKGESVFAGSLCLDGTIQIKTIETPSGSRIGRILEKVQSKGVEKAHIVQITDKVSGYFIAAILALSVVTFLLWMNTDPWQALDHTMALLIVTCPCALGMAAPLALSTAIGKAAGNGILIRTVESFEKLTSITNVFFDKTGTITTGKLDVRTFQPGSRANDDALGVALSLVGASPDHPIASALKRWLSRDTSIKALLLKDIKSSVSKGIEGIDAAGRVWHLGSLRWYRERCGTMPTLPELMSGETLSLLSCDNALAGIFVLADTIKDGAHELIEDLQARGISASLLSGDSKPVAASVGKTVGIPQERCFGELYPEDKASMVKDTPGLRAFVGDGVNDCLAMKESDVGIGVCGGLEASLEVADIYLMEGDCNTMREMFFGAARTVSLIKRNIFYSALYNIVFAPLAMFGYVNPIVAAFVMPISSLTVVLSTSFGKTFEPKKRA